ncbi:hypothetical protein BDB01DRAFT_71665 [Pilobolus umbonatus]|nr:hypothetical protein BDB01DRAFT_71665 [Pilobolus umbonatus]
MFRIRILFFLFFILYCNTQALAQTGNNGFNNQGNPNMRTEENWFQKNTLYIIISAVALVFLALLIWYITKSIKGMRKRLERENQEHMMIIQNSRAVNNHGFHEPIPMNEFHKLPEYAPPYQPYNHRY